MNEAQMQGRVERAKRRVKEVFADGKEDRTAELNGKAEQRFGRAQISYGDAKQNPSGGHRADSADHQVLNLTA